MEKSLEKKIKAQKCVENEQYVWEMEKLLSGCHNKSPTVRYIVPELHDILFKSLPTDMINEINKYLKCDRKCDIDNCFIHRIIRKNMRIEQRKINKRRLKSKNAGQKRLSKKKN